MTGFTGGTAYLQIHTNELIPPVRVPHPRSPGRAKRRAARGFPQHMRFEHRAYVIGDRIYVHPNGYAALRAALVGNAP